MVGNIDAGAGRGLPDLQKAKDGTGPVFDSVKRALALKSLRDEIDVTPEEMAKTILSGDNVSRARRGEVLGYFVPKARTQIEDFLKKLHAAVKSLMEKYTMEDLLFLAYANPPPGSVGIVWELRLKSNKKKSEKRPVRM